MKSKMNGELERMWKQHIEVQSQHLSGGTKENNEKPQSGFLVSRNLIKSKQDC
jgi:hypothetical protein